MSTFAEKIKVLQSKVDLKHKFPHYFTSRTKIIINVAFIFILAIIAINYHLDGNSFLSFSFSCHTQDNSSCLNPFYDCSTANTNLSQAYMLSVGGKCNMAQMPIGLKSKICATGICNKEYVPSNFFVGRTDWFAKYSLQLGLCILLFAFILNHIFYMYKVKKERLING